MASYSEILSTIALLFSAGSLSESALAASRDRPRLKVISRYVEASDYNPESFIYYVHIKDPL
jgi:hypothetical protein